MAYNPYNSASKIVELKQKWNNAKAKGEDTKVYEQEAVNYYNDLRDNGRSDVADYLQKNDAVTASGYLKVLSPDYGASAEGVQSKSDKQVNDNNNYAQQVGKDYDMVYQTIGVTPTRTQYGQDILKGYGLAADQAYKGALGGGSADNGGNVDSYAAANANRQKAAVVSQGYGDVLNYYNSIAGNALTWAGDKANAVGSFAKLNQDNINSDREVIMNQDNNSTVRYQSDNTLKGTKYTTDAEERAQKELNEVEKYLGELDYSGKVYTSQLGAAASTTTDALGNQTFFGMNNVPAPTIYTKDANGNMVTIVPGANTATSGTTGASDIGTGTGTATATNGASVVDIPGLTQGKNVYFLSQNGGYTDANGNPVDTSTVMNDGNRVLLVNRGSGAPSLTYDNSKGTTVYVLDPATGEYYNQSHTISYPASTVNADPNAIIMIGDSVHRTSAVTPIPDGNTGGNSYGTGTGNTGGNNTGGNNSGIGNSGGNNSGGDNVQGSVIDKLAAAVNGGSFQWTNADQAELGAAKVGGDIYVTLLGMLNGITGKERETILNGFSVLGLDDTVVNALK